MAIVFRTTSELNLGVSYIKNAPMTTLEMDGNFAYLQTNMSGSSLNLDGNTYVNGFISATEGFSGTLHGTASYALDSSAVIHPGTGKNSTLRCEGSNIAAADHSTVLGGFGNIVNDHSSIGAVIVGGIANNTTKGIWSKAANSFAIPPVNSKAGPFSFIGGGFQNSATGCYSAVLGGSNNIASGNYAGAYGCNINAIEDNTFYVNNLCTTENANIANTLTVGSALTLTPLDSLPEGTLGTLAVSASHLFFHDGAAWKQVV